MVVESFKGMEQMQATMNNTGLLRARTFASSSFGEFSSIKENMMVSAAMHKR